MGSERLTQDPKRGSDSGQQVLPTLQGVQVADVAFRRKRWSIGTAIVAATMLVLQSIVGALAIGIGPDAGRLDAFGNPLCITSSDQSHPDSDTSHSKLPECCTLGCSAQSQVLEGPSIQPSILLRYPVACENSVGRPTAITHLARDYDPGNPRAPPLAS